MSTTKPHEHGPDERTEMINLVTGLTFNCPFDQSNPTDCPLHSIRQLSTRERIRWAKGLDSEQIMAICENHWECMAEKQQVKAQQYLAERSRAERKK